VIDLHDDLRVNTQWQRRVAAAVVSVWEEPERPQTLKIVVTGVPRLGEAPRKLGASTSIDEAVAIVAAWLHGVATGADGGG
jgi:hypothetical protein